MQGYEFHHEAKIKLLFGIASCLIEIPPADKILLAKNQELLYGDFFFIPIFDWLNYF